MSWWAPKDNLLDLTHGRVVGYILIQHSVHLVWFRVWVMRGVAVSIAG